MSFSFKIFLFLGVMWLSLGLGVLAQDNLGNTVNLQPGSTNSKDSVNIKVESNSNKAEFNNNKAESDIAKAKPNNTTAQDKLSGKVIYGQVKDTVKELEKTAHFWARSAEDVIGEVERHTYVAIPSPGIVGGTFITPMPVPSGMVEMGDRLKPRKKWLNFYLNQMSKLQEYLSGELVNLNKLVNDNAELETSYKILSTINDDCQKHYKNMQEYVSNNELDNLKIGKEALAIYDGMQSFEKKAHELTKEAKTDELKK